MDDGTYRDPAMTPAERSPSPRHRAARRSVALAVGVTLLLGGCSDSSRSDGSSAATRTAASSTSSTAGANDSGSAGCRHDPGDHVDATTTNALHHLPSKGVDRAYLEAVPDGTAGRTTPAPLVLQFHGFSGDAATFDASTGLSRAGTDAGMVVVTPNALGNPTRFNMFGAADQPDDFAFVRTLIAHVEDERCIDTTRVFAAGHSNGSAFTGFLPCRLPATFAAIAMASATIPPICPTKERPSIYTTAGTADPQVPARGGTVGGSTTKIPPAAESVAAWRAALDCDPTPKVTHPQDGVTEELGVNCAGGRQVVYDEITGGTHPWPGSAAGRADRTDSEAGRTYDATARIVEFFASVPGR